jgi:peptidoglycan hydrolase CwlO-like protein
MDAQVEHLQAQVRDLQGQLNVSQAECARLNMLLHELFKAWKNGQTLTAQRSWWSRLWSW